MSFTAEQVAQHCTKDDAWVILNGKIYDVTLFLEEHPGGEEVLFNYVGADASQGFLKIPDHEGNDEVTAALARCYKGNVRKTTTAMKKKDGPTDSSFYLVGILVFGVIVAIWWFQLF